MGAAASSGQLPEVVDLDAAKSAYALEGYDLEITERVAIEIETNPENVRYLRTKRDRMGHTLADDVASEDVSG